MQTLIEKYWPGLKVVPAMANGYTDATFLGAVGIPFDPPDRRVEGADQGLAQDRLIVLQSRVGDHVHKLSHERAPELDEGLFGRVRTNISERGGQVVEGGVGFRRGGEGGVEAGHRTIPLKKRMSKRPMRNDPDFGHGGVPGSHRSGPPLAVRGGERLSR